MHNVYNTTISDRRSVRVYEVYRRIYQGDLGGGGITTLKMGLWPSKTQKWLFGFQKLQTDLNRFSMFIAFLLNNFTKNVQKNFAAPSAPKMGL